MAIRKVILTESELTRLIRNIVIETKEEMMMDTEIDMEDDEMGGEEMAQPEVEKLIANFFKQEILPDLEPEEKTELKNMASRINRKMSDSHLKENMKDRFRSFKEKAMIGGGLGTMITGMITSLGEFTGYSDFELTRMIHDYIEQFGAGRYSGPITVSMVFAGLLMALKGVSDRYSRLNK